ncbi:AraC family transcriptional regulator [bacterium]|nr:AraC family transcriptional regulator [bacterium]
MAAHKLFNSISDFFRSINLKIDQSFDCTIHSLDKLHGEPPMSSPLFRTNYYTFLVIASGKGHYTIDQHWFPLKPFSFYFTNPGHLKSFTIEENVTGFMITFSEIFLKANYPGKLEIDFPFLFDETVPVMYLSKDLFGRIRELCSIMIKEYNGDSLFKQRIVANHLVALLFKTKELLLTHQAKIKAENRPAEITKLFKAALNKNFLQLIRSGEDRLWNVQDYADALHVHPNYLSSIVKAETGKTVKQWVHEKLTAEAKALLKNTRLTVTEIAHQLSFDDVSNFNRFFKSQTGKTPHAFRQS